MKRIFAVLLNLVALAGGFAVGAWFLSRAYPTFDRSTILQKLTAFEQRRDEFDTLFLGSSRVHHQISPALFDRLTREAGMPTRSFNIGVDALFPPEDSYVAEQIFASRPKHLRWVFVEVSMFLPTFAEQSPEAPRSVYWHDWARTSMAVRYILNNTKDFDWSKRKKRWKDWQASIDRCVLHLQMFARNSSNFGRGAAGLSDLLTGRKITFPKQGLGPDDDGYVPILRPDGMYPNDLQHYQKAFAERVKKPVPYESLAPVGQENLDRIVKLIRHAGATPVFVLAPAVSPIVFVPREPAKDLFLDFSDIHTWPELYRHENRADTGHLTKSGSELYTRYIAEGWLASRGAKHDEKTGAAAAATSGLDARASTP